MLFAITFEHNVPNKIINVTPEGNIVSIHPQLLKSSSNEIQ